MRYLIGLLVVLFASQAHAFSYATGGCSNGCAEGEQWLYTNANEVDSAIDAVESSITTLQGRDTIAEHESVDGVNVIVLTEIDTAAEINALTTDTDIVLDTDIGSAVQAYDADLADLADGSLSGSKIGTGLDGTTITAGTVADARVAGTITRDTEWDTAAEINAATLDQDFLTESGSYNITTTGVIQGATQVAVTAGSTASPLASQMLGTMNYYTSGSGVDVTLPGAAAGLSACFYDANGGGVIILDAAAGDQIVLDGAGVGTADAIDSAGNLGDFICLLGIDSSTWINLGRSGTWVDGGAD